MRNTPVPPEVVEVTREALGELVLTMPGEKLMLISKLVRLVMKGDLTEVPTQGLTERLSAGAKIRAARVAAKMTQTQLAAAAGLHAPDLSAMETNSKRVSTRNAQKIAAALGVDPVSFNADRGGAYFEELQMAHRREVAGKDAPRSPDDFGARLRQIRLAKGWSQTQLATAIGTRGSNISVMEKQTHQLTYDMMDRLAAALEVPWPVFVEFERTIVFNQPEENDGEQETAPD